MAGDWIKIEHALPNKPEVMLIARELAISEMEVVGHLVCFWSWVDQNLTEECPVVSGTISGLDRVAGRTGFADAMIKAGWLDVDGDRIKVPNYDDHLSQSAKSRGVEAKRKRRQRVNVPDKTGHLSDICPVENREKPALQKNREEICKDRKVSGKDSGVFNSVSKSVLADTTKLREWFEAQARAKRPVLTISEPDWLKCVTAAVKALADGKEPVKLFTWIIGRKKWENLTGEAEDRARGRINEWRKTRRGPVNPAVAGLASSFGTDEGDSAR